MEVQPEALLAEPDGWTKALVFLLVSVAFFGLYAGFELVFGSGQLSSLVIAVGMALAGVTELLPAERRRLAGALRVTAIGILFGVFVVSLARVLA